MYRSNSSSPLVLLARDSRDAEQWQAEYPELAEAVGVVFVDRAQEGLRGRITKAAYYTESAARHRDAAGAIVVLRHCIAKTKPERDYVVTEYVEPIWPTVDLTDLLRALRDDVVALAAMTRIPHLTDGEAR